MKNHPTGKQAHNQHEGKLQVSVFYYLIEFHVADVI
jgi:hypothetical protein